MCSRSRRLSPPCRRVPHRGQHLEVRPRERSPVGGAQLHDRLELRGPQRLAHAGMPAKRTGIYGDKVVRAGRAHQGAGEFTDRPLHDPRASAADGITDRSEIRGLFMTVADEADFSLHLRAGVERVAILDGKDGPDGRPFGIASISDASGPQAWIFERRDDAPLQWKSLLGELARSLMRATRTTTLSPGCRAPLRWRYALPCPRAAPFGRRVP